MTSNKMDRLNQLFERMMNDNASSAECFELRVLYQEYFFDGREYNQPNNHRQVELKMVSY